MPARVQASHVMSNLPAAGATLTSSEEKTAGGMENIGTATSSAFTMAEIMSCTDTYSVPPNTPVATPPPYDGLETGATPVISLTNISLPTPWTVPATGNSESLSGLGTAANNTSAGTYDIFPDVKLIVVGPTGAVVAGVGSQTTTVTITGPVTELDDWVVPWTPTDKPPNFDGSDFGLARSSGYGNTQKGGPGIFYVTFTLKFFTAAFSDGPSPMSPVELDFKVGVINNYDNDRERYMDAYEEAYKSLTKVPELSEWQT